jgi:hypothetical protein
VTIGGISLSFGVARTALGPIATRTARIDD